MRQMLSWHEADALLQKLRTLSIDHPRPEASNLAGTVIDQFGDRDTAVDP